MKQLKIKIINKSKMWIVGYLSPFDVQQRLVHENYESPTPLNLTRNGELYVFYYLLLELKHIRVYAILRQIIQRSGFRD